MTIKTSDEKLYDLWLVLSSINRDNLFPDIDKIIKECAGDEKKINEEKQKFETYKSSVVPDKWKALSMWRRLRTRLKDASEELFDKINEMEKDRRKYLSERQQNLDDIEAIKKTEKKNIKEITAQEAEIEAEFEKQIEDLKEKTGIEVLAGIGQQTIVCGYVNKDDAKEVEIDFKEDWPYNEVGFIRDLLDRWAWKMGFLPNDLVAAAAEVLEGEN